MRTKEVTLGDKVYALLPCPAVGLKAIGKNFALIGQSTDAGIDALVDGLYFGIKRGLIGKPGADQFTRQLVEWNVDATNLVDLVNAFAEVNGAETGSGDPGEASAASLSGTASSPMSSTPQDGPGTTANGSSTSLD